MFSYQFQWCYNPPIIFIKRIQISMPFSVLPGFVLHIALLGTLILLGSCTTNKRTSSITPPKVFQYSYQEPSRRLENASLAQKLSKGKVGDRSTSRLAGRKSFSIRLGEYYFSANGHKCRKYTVNSSTLKTACNINNRWYQAQPILINK